MENRKTVKNDIFYNKKNKPSWTVPSNTNILNEDANNNNLIKITTLEQINSSLKNKNNYLTKENSDLKDKIKILNYKIESLEKLINDNDADNLLINSKKNSTIKNNNNKNIFSNKYKIKYKELQNKYNTELSLETKLNTLFKDIANNSNDFDYYNKFKLLVKEYKNELDNKDLYINSLIDKYENKINEFQLSYDKLKNENSEINNRYKDQGNNLNTKILQYKNNILELENKISELNKQIFSLNKENEEIISNYNYFLKNNTNNNSKVDSLKRNSNTNYNYIN